MKPSVHLTDEPDDIVGTERVEHRLNTEPGAIGLGESLASRLISQAA
jgi:hypothetical protein